LLTMGYTAQLLIQEYEGSLSEVLLNENQTQTMRILTSDTLVDNCDKETQVWMTSGLSIKKLPENFVALAEIEGQISLFKLKETPVYGMQFYPQVYYTTQGKTMLENFLIHIAGVKQEWTSELFIENTVTELKQQIGSGKVVLGLSGGVDSTVAAVLLHKAIGENLYCIFVNNGLLRKNEFSEVLKQYEHLGLNVKGVDASQQFLGELKGVSDPEEKRKIIGRV